MGESGSGRGSDTVQRESTYVVAYRAEKCEEASIKLYN